nr:MAG TPA: hypothetical protein [Caudoviricetes sp.]
MKNVEKIMQLKRQETILLALKSLTAVLKTDAEGDYIGKVYDEVRYYLTSLRNEFYDLLDGAE